jgi:hypothetical protein
MAIGAVGVALPLPNYVVCLAQLIENRTTETTNPGICKQFLNLLISGFTTPPADA